MKCGKCGGRVEWRGWRLDNFTHTECLDCGAINSQIVEDQEESEEPQYEEKHEKQN